MSGTDYRSSQPVVVCGFHVSLQRVGSGEEACRRFGCRSWGLYKVEG